MTTTARDTVDGIFDGLEGLTIDSHERVHFHHDEATGLSAIIAVHDTRLGPALGGTRFYPYASGSDALTDVLRLSEGMTYKAAAAGLDLGGGKAVIVGDPATLRSRALLRAYGRFVGSLGGRYITAGDVGVTAEDLDVVGEETPYVVGRTVAAGGSGDSGFATALGVFSAMRAAAAHTFGSADLGALTVGVEGAGKVGLRLIGLLRDQGARVVLAEPDAGARRRAGETHLGLELVDSVVDAEVDVYAPCALGGTLTPASVGTVRAGLVCGAANNQLSTPDVEEMLVERGTVWVPDYVANAGGLVQVGGERDGSTPDQVRVRVAALEDRVRDIFATASAERTTAGAAARALARRRLDAAEAPPGR
ncbi:valine dehydrogenase [Mumia sp. zg.B53]|uniref:Glu/Leu/Phe/Val family dehydrogenase n=1 Tax=unclassified Mumia TaxID=2621872 RepID=UPI001C6F4392|nr:MULTISPECIES: Glu/Leu/Phe/Val dehydrogenase dimerization domain-containing protein [unclassified Mumia]MBW9207369.1 valine dehydrogenase [Mumia sp. zg.B17]MBW9210283.1 valine dehydrogenase [Mumia sp. zg.B21]MBW9214893.1 valine dehydrogenase [Mumia sp. zg.B53]